MARREALLRLHKALSARRNSLMKRLGGEMADLGHCQVASAAGDSADAAFDSGSDEIASKLAELEARELGQVQRALSRLKQGTYGLCEICHTRILVARLNALPYSTMCIKCQREVEAHGENTGDLEIDWDKVADAERRFADRREVDLSRLEMDFSK